MAENTLESIAVDVCRRLDQAGHEAYWVGGCVRDREMGLPVKDYDIATSAHPADVRRVFPCSDLIGAHFGVTLIVESGKAFEVATFRRDGKYVDHRHPTHVTFGTIEQDARRRDFTINAVYYDPLRGRVVDMVDGLADIEARRIRAIGDPPERFEEDALRLLRAVRFACRFGFQIETETWEAMREKAGRLASVSAERIREELVRTVTGPNRGKALERLSDSGLLAVILPELEETRGVEQPARYHPEGDVFTHTRLALDRLRKDPPVETAMAVLLHDVGKPPTYEKAEDRIRFSRHATVGAELAEKILRRLRFPNQQRQTIVSVIDRHMRFIDAHRMREATLRRFLASPTIEHDLETHRVDCLASNGDLANYHFCREKLEEFRRENETILPEPLLSGHDLIEMGLAPGPSFKHILESVADAQMEGELSSREEALEWILRKFGREF